jgi:nicotinamidase-related amidase
MTKITRKNTAVVLIDHQVGLLTGVRDMTTQDLEHNVVHLAKAAKVLGVPVVVTNAATDFWGPTIPALVDAVDGQDILTRRIINSWDDTRFVKRIEGRPRSLFTRLHLHRCPCWPVFQVPLRTIPQRQHALH